MRHLMAFAMGQRDEDHLAAAAFNIMAMIHNEEIEGKFRFVESTPEKQLSDMPKFEASQKHWIVGVENE